MFGSIKNLFKKFLNDTPSSEEETVDVDETPIAKQNISEDTFEPSQIEVLPEPDKSESVIKKSKKRIVKYRK